MNRTPNIDDELIIEIVKGMTMFAFQRGNWQKPIEPHELIEYTTAIKTLLANKIKEAEFVGAERAYDDVGAKLLSCGVRRQGDDRLVFSMTSKVYTELTGVHIK